MKITLVKKEFDNKELRNPDINLWESAKTQLNDVLDKIPVDEDGYPLGIIRINIDFISSKSQKQINTPKRSKKINGV